MARPKPLDLNSIYGELNEIRASDERFMFDNFQHLTLDIIVNSLTNVRQNRNLSQLTQARMLMATINMNRGKDDTPSTDISEFLPHPIEWNKTMGSSTFAISRDTAQKVLNQMDELPSRMKVTLLKFKSDLESV